jgi:glycosyltransferase involved in cell wall biosynthesis
MATSRTKPGPGLNVGFFGTFRPKPGDRALTTGIMAVSTGLVAALAQSDSIASITVFSQIGSDQPRGEAWSKVRMVPCWKYDNPFSLLRSFRVLLNHASKVDGFVFNTAITDFGRSAAANVVGLLLPPFLSRLSRKPVVTYVHYFLETADISQLGYRPSLLQRVGVRLLERLLLTSTTVVVPLESQRSIIEQTFGLSPRQLLIPFTEPFGWIAMSDQPPVESPVAPGEPMRILLLGVWGPQKDLQGALRALLLAKERGGRFTVTITGAINPHFPDSRRELDRLKATVDPEWFRYVDAVPEAKLLELLRSHDLLILPYNAAGGYSSSMSVGAYCGTEIISYDHPQLREVATELGIQPSFVVKGDIESLVQRILTFDAEIDRLRERREPIPRKEYDARTREMTGQLAELLEMRDTRRAPR